MKHSVLSQGGIFGEEVFLPPSYVPGGESNMRESIKESFRGSFKGGDGCSTVEFESRIDDNYIDS